MRAHEIATGLPRLNADYSTDPGMYRGLLWCAMASDTDTEVESRPQVVAAYSALGFLQLGPEIPRVAAHDGVCVAVMSNGIPVLPIRPSAF